MRLHPRRRLSSQEKTKHATFSNSPTPSLRLVVFWHLAERWGGYTFRCIGMLGHGARSKRRQPSRYWFTMLTPLYSNSHNYRTLRASHSPFLSCSSLSLSLSLSASLFRLRPILSLISSPCSATLVSDYQYHVADILSGLSFFFSFSFKDSSRMTRR